MRVGAIATTAVVLVFVCVSAPAFGARSSKVEALDTFKNKPPLPTIKANDVAVLMSIVYEM